MLIQNGILFKEKSDSDWTLHEGAGNRTCDSYVMFETPFREAPQVSIALCQLDTDKDENVRIIVEPKSISAAGFEVEFQTWSSTKVYRAGVSWFAIGKKPKN